MIISSTVVSMVPDWALFGALWAAVGVFVMSALTCYAWRRAMGVPGVEDGRASVRASVASGGVCALVSAVVVVGVGLLV